MHKQFKYVKDSLFSFGKQKVLNKKVYYEDEVRKGNILIVGEKGLKDSGFNLNYFGNIIKRIGGYFV